MSKKFIDYIDSENVQAIEEIIDTSDLTSVDNYGDSALHIAVLKENETIVELLLKKGIDTNMQNKEGKTALHHAAEYNLANIAERIISAGGNLNIADNFGNQPLWTAVFNVKGKAINIPIVELYLKHGAEKNYKNKAGRSPLDFARQVEFIPLIELLDKY